jgi:hypothetical protein
MTVAAALFIPLLCAMLVSAAVTPIKQPAGVGSQLILYYDTRPGFTTFVNIRNTAPSVLRVQVDFWDRAFETKVTQTFELPSGGGRVIDAGALQASQGLAAQQGIAFASIVDNVGNPIHIGEALMGNFTVANLTTGSAWGGPAAARSARVESNDSEPTGGTVVDGTTVAYQTIQPSLLTLGTYYDPQSLAPAEAHGNQLIFVSFKDPTGVGAPVTFAVTAWSVIVSQGAAGVSVANLLFTTGGVDERDVVDFFGEDANGAAGGAVFRISDLAATAGVSRFMFFVQSLGTFGTGYLLPAG